MESGTRLGPYEILEQLGAGGMGEVYLAEDTRLHRKVAIKVLPEQFAKDPERLARFEQEARAAAALNHPHIAAVFDVGHEAGTRFMVQEYLEGRSLRAYLEDGAPKLRTALQFATEVATALRAAHAAGIVHRDLKPDNVFVTGDGHVKVLDFGLAKLTESATVGGTSDTMSPTVLSTVAGQIMGTAGYMAPEQVDGRPVDRRADLFALGCLLHEMVAGSRAFAGSSLHETLHRIGHEPALPLSKIDASLPAELERIVGKLLEKEADDRYQHADDVAVDLRALSRAVEAGVAAPAGPVAVTPVEGGAGGSPTGRLAGIVIVAVALIAAWYLAPDGTAPPTVLRAELSIPGLGLSRNMEGRPLSISADGQLIASHATIGGMEMIAIRHLDTGQTRLLEITSPSINEPVISPDGEWVAYVDQSLYLVSTSTGADEELATFAGRGIHRGLVWVNSDEVLTIRGQDVVLVSLTADEVRTVYTSPEGVAVSMPAILPTGRHALLAQIDQRDARPSWELVALELATGQLTPLDAVGSSPIYVPGGYLAYSNGGQALVAPFDVDAMRFTSDPFPLPEPVAIDYTGSLQMRVSDSGTMVYLPVDRFRSSRLMWVRRDGSEAPFEVDAISRLPALGDPRISPDGERVVLTSVFDIYTVDLPSRTVTPVAAGLAQSFYPVWLGNTMRILYSGERNRLFEIYSRLADSSASEQLTASSPNPLRTVSWVAAHDQLLVREETADRGMDILALSPDEPEGRTAVLAGEYDEFTAAVSPDGRWIAYVTNETGRDEVWVAGYPSIGRRVQVSQDGGREPVWSPDSSEIFFWSGDQFVAAQLSDDSQLRVSGRDHLFGRAYVRYRWNTQYDVHPDGERFLMIAAGDPNGNVRIVQNWAATLERLAGGGGD